MRQEKEGIYDFLKDPCSSFNLTKGGDYTGTEWVARNAVMGV